MKEIFIPFMKKEWLLRMFFVGVIFIAVAVPFKILFSLVPGMTEVRPANTIPVVFGLLWGPAGAWGIAIANAITDIITGSSFKVWVPGLIINFFYAWLPYKFWYCFDFNKKGVEEPRLRSVKDILKFIFIVFLSSLVTTMLLSLLFEILGFQNYGASGLLLFFNNFDFAVVLGIPLTLILTSRSKAVFWIPYEIRIRAENALETDESAELETEKKNDALKRICDSLIIIMSVFGVLYYLASRFHETLIPFKIEVFLLVLFFSFEILYIFRPFAKYRSTVFKVSIRTLPIRAKVVLGFLLVTVFSVILVGVFSYNTRITIAANQRDLWEYIYITVGISLNVMFLVSTVFLHFVEKNITEPIEMLVEKVDEFAGRDHYADAQAHLSPNRNRGQIKTGDEIEGLSEAFDRMMDDITIYVSHLAAVTAEKERIGAELNVATQIQANMLPSIFPPYPERIDFDLYATMDPAKEVGGDFYDFFLIDDDHLAMVMADVSGKGVPAALFMVITKTLIKNRTQMGGTPAEILGFVNEQLCEGNESELFVTVWLGILELSTGKGIAANAGHEHPVLKRSGGDFELVKYRHSPAVATIEGIHFREREFEMHPGDILFVYTDGVAEATNPDNQFYGTERMLNVLNLHKDSTMPELLSSVRKDIELFVGDAPQFDDITMLSLIYYGASTDNKKVQVRSQPMVEMKVEAKTEKLDQILAFLDKELENAGCNMKVQTQMDIALEEMFVNIASYAYPDTEGDVIVQICTDEKEKTVSVTLIDSGIPFNPLEKPDPDVALPSEKRKIGGLGIYMVKKSMDNVQYEYSKGYNIFTMSKKW